MHLAEGIFFVLVFVVALVPLMRVVLVRLPKTVSAVLLACVGVALVASVPQPQKDIMLDSALPKPVVANGMYGSSACMGCHPGQYSTWHASFHRTMTQRAAPESVVGAFDGRKVEWRDRAWILETRDDEFWVTEVEPGSSSPRAELATAQRIVMTTGSRHEQIYWTPGDDGSLKQFPLVWEISMARWIPSEHTFLRPDDWRQSVTTWNQDCIRCHSVGPHPNKDFETNKWDTKVTELGIACAACHGPAEKHMRAHRNPLHRHKVRSSGEADPTIVNPARLDKERSAEVCGQCHSFVTFFDNNNFHEPTWREFRAGGKLDQHVKLWTAKNDQNRFWPDGSGRIGGREYNTMIMSGCFTEGEMTCLSCHTMHGDEPRDQLKPLMKSNEACLQCHEDMRERVAEHTFHDIGSSGSQCYNCHMTYTSYALLGAVRMHRVDSPTASGRSTRDRPNACNLCHLDKTLAWTGEKLTERYGQKATYVTDDHHNVAASVMWMMKGDAMQRTVAAWHMGQAWAIEASGDKWMVPYLSKLLVDPYSAIRLIAHRSLVEVTGENIPFYYIWTAAERQKVADQYLAKWVAARQADGETGPPETLNVEPGRLQDDVVEQIYRQRDNKKFSLSE